MSSEESMPKRRRDDWAATASNALSYTIDSCSSISANFQPHFIKDEAPDDLSSRWSGAPSSSNPSQQSQQPRGPVYFGDSPAGPSSLPFDDIIRAGDSAAVRRVRELARDRQYILLRLDQLALVQSITFGKPSKPNPCNIKDADVYCGRDKQHLSHALRVTMANDPHYESFSIPHTSSLCRYIMICPVSTHAPNYNPSVWFIGVQGSIDRSKVHNAWRLLANSDETHAMGLTLKFLRDRGMMQEFTSLKQRIESSSSDFKFEHPLITKLHQSLVVEGDYDAAQACLHEMAEAGIFDDTLHSATPGLQWELIDDSERLSSTEENENRPCPRSGHQMLFVPPHEGDGAALYLFGGFNGHSSLADFWRFDLEADGMGGRWVSLGRFLDVGPRSCHSMCLDDKTGDIYLMGRYVDPISADLPGAAEIGMMTDQGFIAGEEPNDLWVYHTRGLKKGHWSRLDSDVHSHGGPRLTHDSAMVFDPYCRNIWVFGGRHNADAQLNEDTWSGLYTYHVDSQTWTAETTQRPNDLNRITRYGHSMLINWTGRDRYIWILGGRRGGKLFNDIWALQPDTRALFQISSDVAAEGGPEPSFTQRGVHDPETQTLQYFPSDSGDSDPIRRDRFYSFRHTGNWTSACLTSNQLLDPESHPDPRSAHQFVYNAHNRVHYLYGGTSTLDSDRQAIRFNDLWALKLSRPSLDRLLNKAHLLILRQRFYDICANESPSAALHYLRNNMAPLADPEDESAQQLYRQCMHHLMALPSENRQQDSPKSSKTSSHVDVRVWESRTDVFRGLLELVPREHKEIPKDLVDLASNFMTQS